VVLDDGIMGAVHEAEKVMDGNASPTHSTA
jgi:hypothetical protein